MIYFREIWYQDLYDDVQCMKYCVIKTRSSSRKVAAVSDNWVDHCLSTWYILVSRTNVLWMGLIDLKNLQSLADITISEKYSRDVENSGKTVKQTTYIFYRSALSFISFIIAFPHLLFFISVCGYLWRALRFCLLHSFMFF